MDTCGSKLNGLHKIFRHKNYNPPTNIGNLQGFCWGISLKFFKKSFHLTKDTKIRKFGVYRKISLPCITRTRDFVLQPFSHNFYCFFSQTKSRRDKISLRAAQWYKNGSLLFTNFRYYKYKNRFLLSNNLFAIFFRLQNNYHAYYVKTITIITRFFVSRRRNRPDSRDFLHSLNRQNFSLFPIIFRCG